MGKKSMMPKVVVNSMFTSALTGASRIPRLHGSSWWIELVQARRVVSNGLRNDESMLLLDPMRFVEPSTRRKSTQVGIALLILPADQN